MLKLPMTQCLAECWLNIFQISEFSLLFISKELLAIESLIEEIEESKNESVNGGKLQVRQNHVSKELWISFKTSFDRPEHFAWKQEAQLLHKMVQPYYT